jgi:hypothetical protein
VVGAELALSPCIRIFSESRRPLHMAHPAHVDEATATRSFCSPSCCTTERCVARFELAKSSNSTACCTATKAAWAKGQGAHDRRMSTPTVSSRYVASFPDVPLSRSTSSSAAAAPDPSDAVRAASDEHTRDQDESDLPSDEGGQLTDTTAPPLLDTICMLHWSSSAVIVSGDDRGGTIGAWCDRATDLAKDGSEKEGTDIREGQEGGGGTRLRHKMIFRRQSSLQPTLSLLSSLLLII